MLSVCKFGIVILASESYSRTVGYRGGFAIMSLCMWKGTDIAWGSNALSILCKKGFFLHLLEYLSGYPLLVILFFGAYMP